MATEQEKKLNIKMEMMQKQIDELLAWKKKKEIQQISLPLDESSKNIINNI